MRPTQILIPRLTPIFRHVPTLPTKSIGSGINPLPAATPTPNIQTHTHTHHANAEGSGRWWVPSTNMTVKDPSLSTSPLLQHTLSHHHHPTSSPPTASSSGSNTNPDPKTKASRNQHQQENDEQGEGSSVPPPTIAWVDHLSMV